MIRSVPRFARYAWFVLAYNLVVILWGAVVRATGSGAGCGSHWPLCNGEVLPSIVKSSTVIEFAHRATSGIALLLVVGLVAGSRRVFAKGHPARLWAALSMAFILSEAAVGAGLVLFELVADNQSMARALFMATHLVNTFFLLGVLTLTAHFASGAPRLALAGRSRDAWIFAVAFLAVLLVGSSGAVAALGDTLFPAQSLEHALAQDLSPTAHGLIRLRLLHPTLAVLTALGILGLCAWAGPRSPGRWPAMLAGLTLGQTLLGGLNVVLLAPIPLQLAHLLLADFIWIALVLLAAEALREPAPAVVSAAA